jgi:hypothetical protein
MGINSSSMLVDLNISVWTANKVDRAATDTVTSGNNAVRDAGQFKKNLMAGTNKRKAIADFSAGIRSWHNSRTLPWADKGSRLLPTSLFLDYKAEIDERKTKFDQMVKEFLGLYPTLVNEAALSLGTLFNAGDYPATYDVASKFGVRLVFSPVPDAGDFRLDIAEEDLKELRSGYETSFNERLSDAMKAPWNQLHTLLKGMSAKLTDDMVGDTEVKRRYHDTLITNAQDLCQMLTHLNVTGDPELERARRLLEKSIVGVDIEDIKTSPEVLSDVKDKLDTILKDFSW